MFGIIGCIICLFFVFSGATQIIGRLFCGISTGINSQTIPIYINELATMEISGTMGSFYSAFILISVLISYIMGLGIPNDFDHYDLNDSWWRFVFALPIITCFIRLILLLTVFKYDTPFSLMKKKDHKSL